MLQIITCFVSDYKRARKRNGSSADISQLRFVFGKVVWYDEKKKFVDFFMY